MDDGYVFYIAKVVVIAVLLIAAFELAVSIGAPIGCRSRWEGSDHATKWSFTGGCRVEVRGKFVPENTVRRIDL